MPRDRVDFDTVRSIGLSLPNVEESTAYRSPALKVRGRLLTCIPINRSVEPDSLAVSIGFEKRSVLLASTPDIYYLTDHYRDYPIVLVRLSRIGLGELRNLLEVAWQSVNAQTSGLTSSARKQSQHRKRKRWAAQPRE
jgi:hypothetical protein